MATVSFDDEYVVVRSKEKSKEIMDALSSEKSAYEHIKPIKEYQTKEAKEFVRKWLSR